MARLIIPINATLEKHELFEANPKELPDARRLLERTRTRATNRVIYLEDMTSELIQALIDDDGKKWLDSLVQDLNNNLRLALEGARSKEHKNEWVIRKFKPEEGIKYCWARERGTQHPIFCYSVIYNSEKKIETELMQGLFRDLIFLGNRFTPVRFQPKEGQSIAPLK